MSASEFTFSSPLSLNLLKPYHSLASPNRGSKLKFPTRQAAKTAIFEYLETFYNTRRLHSALGYKKPCGLRGG